jgi:hypothetical protein
MRKVLQALGIVFGLLILAEAADLFYLSGVKATVTTTSSSVTAGGNGSTTVFSFPFIGVQASDIVVTYTNSSGVATVLLPTQYTLTLNAANPGQVWGVGGTVTYPLAGSPIATGTTLTITRTVPYQQTVSSNQGQLFSLAVEQALDLLEMQIQQIQLGVSNALVLAPNDPCVGQLSPLPLASARANQILGFNSTGCVPIAGQPASALVSAAMQPVVAASTTAAAAALLGVGGAITGTAPVGTEADWPGLTAPAGWFLENGAAISRTTYSALLNVIAPVFACTITSGSSTITGISSTVGFGTGWIIESPGSSALTTGQTIAAVGGSSVTITGGNATANASQCQAFPYGTAQNGTFNVPQRMDGTVTAGIDVANVNLSPTYCTGNPAYLNAVCGAQSQTATSTLSSTNQLPQFTPSGDVVVVTGSLRDLVNANGGTSFGSLNGGTQVAIVNVTMGFVGNPVGSASPSPVVSSPFPSLPPLRIRNRIIYSGVGG